MSNESLFVLSNSSQAAAALDPIRMQILEALRVEDDSSSGLSRRLGLPRQKINYHLRELEKHGFVALVEERKKRNFVERVYRVTARHYVLDPSLLGADEEAPTEGDRSSASYLIAVAARTVREAAALREGSRDSGRRVATFAMESDIAVPTPAAFEEFRRDLESAVARVIAKHNDESGRSRYYRIVVGTHPKPRRGARSKEEL